MLTFYFYGLYVAMRLCEETSKWYEGRSILSLVVLGESLGLTFESRVGEVNKNEER